MTGADGYRKTDTFLANAGGMSHEERYLHYRYWEHRVLSGTGSLSDYSQAVVTEQIKTARAEMVRLRHVIKDQEIQAEKQNCTRKCARRVV